MTLVVTVLIVFVILCLNEWWWRRQNRHGEGSRKFIHVVIGSFAAFWPVFLTWDQIRLLSVGFLLVVAVSKYFNVFKSIHSVQRPTWGEIFFAVVTGVLTLVTHDKAIFATALLQMSLADGLAAIVGVKYGRRKYAVFNHRKTYEGTATFFLCSVLILLVYSFFARSLQPGEITVIAAAATLIENVGIMGSDNLLVPLLVAGLLR